MTASAPAVLVTGSLGFVGSHIVRELAALGHRVIATDLARAGELPVDVAAWWEPVSSGIEYRRLDVRDEQAIGLLREHTTLGAIVHAAAITTGTPAALEEVNLGGTAAVLSGFTPPVRVLVSSASVYDESRATGPALSEDDPVVAVPEATERWTYPESKRAAELWALRRGGIRIARVGACYGPLERPTGHRTAMSPVYEAMHAARRGRRGRFTGDRPTDLLFVRDTARGIAAVLRAREAPPVVNIARHEPMTAARLTAALAPGREGAQTAAHTIPLTGRRLPLDTDRLARLGADEQVSPEEAFHEYRDWLEHHEH